MHQALCLAKCLYSLGNVESAVKLLTSVIGSNSRGSRVVNAAEELNFAMCLWYTSLFGMNEVLDNDINRIHSSLVKALSLSQTAHETLRCLAHDKKKAMTLNIDKRRRGNAIYEGEADIDNLKLLLSRDILMIKSLLESVETDSQY